MSGEDISIRLSSSTTNKVRVRYFLATAETALITLGNTLTEHKISPPWTRKLTSPPFYNFSVIQQKTECLWLFHTAMCYYVAKLYCDFIFYKTSKLMSLHVTKQVFCCLLLSHDTPEFTSLCCYEISYLLTRGCLEFTAALKLFDFTLHTLTFW